MTLYMTKTWGFDAPSGPLQFSMQGWRDNARKILQPNDTVLIVGTLDEPTPLDDRGQLLGIVEVSREIVSSLDFYSQSDIRPNELDENGNYRWPYGLRVRRAWQFVKPRRHLKDISSRVFSQNSALGIVPLSIEEAALVDTLPRLEIQVRPSRTFPEPRNQRPSRRNAPLPTTTRRGVMHMRRAPAYTYAMTIDGGGIAEPFFKIGWAFDYSKREQQFNHASLPELGGLRYKTVLHHDWTQAIDAFRMERALLRHLSELRHSQNSEVVGPITLSDLEATWQQCLHRLLRGR